MIDNKEYLCFANYENQPNFFIISEFAYYKEKQN